MLMDFIVNVTRDVSCLEAPALSFNFCLGQGAGVVSVPRDVSAETPRDVGCLVVLSPPVVFWQWVIL